MADLSGASIVIANNFAGPGLGGGETQLLPVIEACVEAGMRVTVAYQAGSPLGEAAAARGADAIEVDFRASRLPAVAGRLAEVARDTHADIIEGTGFLTNIVTRLAARTLDVALVNVVHVEPGASLLDGGSRGGLALRLLADRATHRRVDRYIAVSDAVAAGLAAGGVASESVTVIRNGVDPDAVRLAASQPFALPSALESTDDGPLVGVVARLETVKGVEDFVAASAIVAERFGSARFVIAGAGSLESRLREAAVARGLAGRLTFLGHVSPVEPLLAALDVLVTPSLSEGLPMTPLEAMALGKPVVATAVGGTPEIVDHGATGLLVPSRDQAALASAICDLLGDSGRARAMGEAGREKVEKEFTLSRMTSQYLETYEELLQAKRKGRQ